MQLTQIQGSKPGATQQVPQGQELNLPTPQQAAAKPNALSAPQGYIQNTANGQQVVPHANVPVAVNGKVVQKPTPVQHGDSVTVNHGAKNPTVLAVHKPGEKLTEQHIGEHVKKAGLNLNEAQIRALTEEIELVEHHKFIFVAGALGGVIAFLLVIIAFLFFMMSGKISEGEFSKLQKSVTKVQKDVKEVEEIQEEIQESTGAEAIASLEEQIAELEEKLALTGEQVTSVDEATREDIQSILDQFEIYSQSLQEVQGITDKIKAFEELLQASEIGQLGESMQYYQDLQAQCGENECCLNSLNTMMQNSYKLAEQGQCISGEKVNRLQCLDSYVWCVPEGAVPATSVTQPSQEEVQAAVEQLMNQIGTALEDNSLSKKKITNSFSIGSSLSPTFVVYSDEPFKNYVQVGGETYGPYSLLKGVQEYQGKIAFAYEEGSPIDPTPFVKIGDEDMAPCEAGYDVGAFDTGKGRYGVLCEENRGSSKYFIVGDNRYEVDGAGAVQKFHVSDYHWGYYLREKSSGNYKLFVDTQEIFEVESMSNFGIHGKNWFARNAETRNYIVNGMEYGKIKDLSVSEEGVGFVSENSVFVNGKEYGPYEEGVTGFSMDNGGWGFTYIENSRGRVMVNGKDYDGVFVKNLAVSGSNWVYEKRVPGKTDTEIFFNGELVETLDNISLRRIYLSGKSWVAMIHSNNKSENVSFIANGKQYGPYNGSISSVHDLSISDSGWSFSYLNDERKKVLVLNGEEYGVYENLFNYSL